MFHNKKNHLFDLIDHFPFKRIRACSIYDRSFCQINLSKFSSRRIFLLELLLLLWSSMWTLPVQATTDCMVQTDIPKVECEALLSLYQNTDGANWSSQRGWNVDNKPCKWEGIVCTEGTQKYVKTISLTDNNLSGTLPKELDSLSKLESLDLSWNQLSGLLPEWNNMTALQTLYLYTNQLSGPLPKWNNMTTLRYLSLSDNQLSGPLLEWNNMTALQSLELSHNQFNGDLPEWNNMTSLQGLYLSHNQLSGPLPEWKSMTALRYLFLSTNQLNGSLPSEWGNMSELRSLELDNNQLTGPLPPEWGNLKLFRLSLVTNSLSGSLPPQWNTMDNLEGLYLNHNHLSGNIPKEWSHFNSLYTLLLHHNQLSSEIPPEFTSSSLRKFEVNYNMLTAVSDDIVEWVNQRDPNWQTSQTVSPHHFTVTPLTADQVRLNWEPILYQEDNGYYEIGYTTQAGGPYNTIDRVPGDKSASTYLLANLTPATLYYFVIRTHTSNPDNDTENPLTSLWSNEFSTQMPAQKFSLHIEIEGQGTVSGSGIQCENDCDENYEAGTPVTLEAQAKPSFFFAGWSDDCQNLPNPATFIMDHARICTATFSNISPTTYSLTLSTVGQGRITGTGIDCGTDCSESYPAGTLLTLTATPDPFHVFAGWGGECGGQNQILNVTMNQAKTCSATFNPIEFPLTLNKIGTGEGDLTVDPIGTSCAENCFSYPVHTLVTLTAVPAPGSQLLAWEGDCTPIPNQLFQAQITVEQAKNCTAKFEKVFPLTLAPAPQNGFIESGTLEGNLFKPDGQLQCGSGYSLCTKNDYLIHTPVFLQARAASGYLFGGWEGDCQNLPNPAPLTMEQARTCSAIFTPASSTIKLGIEMERSPGGEGYVIGTLIDDQNKRIGSPVIDCGKDCDEDFSQVQRILLTVVPSSTSILSKWECNGQTQSRRQPIFTLQQNLTCVARFDRDPASSLVTLSKMGQGRLSAKRQGEAMSELTCATAGACQISKAFSLGQIVVVTATPDPGFVTHWTSGSCVPDPKNLNNPNRVIFPANLSTERLCQAEFVRDENSATQASSVQVVGEGVVTGHIRDSVLGQFYCKGSEPCKNYYQPHTEVKLTAVPGFSSVFKGWQGCRTSSSPSIFVPLPTSECTATFVDRHEQIVDRFCRKMGEGGAYVKQGTKKIPVYNTIWCSPTNRTRLQEAFRLAYPAKMMMDLQQGVTNSWPDHFASKVTSWYRQYPDGVKNIRTLMAGNVELQVRLKDQNDQEQVVTISYGKEPTGEEGTFLFKRTEEQFQKLYDLAGELRRDFFQKLNNDVEVMRFYRESENQTRLQNGLWLALPALLTAEENLRLGTNWPESFNGVSWYDPQPPWSVLQARANHTRGVRSVELMTEGVIDLQLTLLNDNHQDEEVSVLIYYGAPPQGGILYPR